MWGTPAVLFSDAEALSGSAWPRSILVATDGSSGAEPAVIAARALAERHVASVAMVAVYAPGIPMPSSPTRRGFEQCEPCDRHEAAALLRAVRRQRRRAQFRRDWPLHLEVGDPGTVIVRLASETPVDLVMLGIGSVDPANRRSGGRTTLRAAQYVVAPLYAVVAGCEAPRRAVVAFPDGRVDEPTLRAAAACVAPGGRLWIVTRSSGDALPHINGLTVERVDVDGDMLDGVLRVATAQTAHLVAVPAHGDPGPVRAFIPSLADALLRSARCSVLAVPTDRKAGTGDAHAI